MTTDIFGLDELTENQSGKYLTHNLALRKLEAMTSRVLSMTTGIAEITPAAGDVYIVSDEYGENTQWAEDTYALNDIRVPTTHNGYRYKVTTAGTSASTEPASWATTVGNTTTDGSVTWTCDMEIWPTSVSYAAGYIAHYYASAWHYYAPVDDVPIWCVDETGFIIYDGSDWATV